MAVQQGMNQQTPAVQTILSVLRGGRTSNGSRRRTRRASGSSTKSTNGGSRRKRKLSASGKKSARRFVKGSPEAKRHMAKLRRMRKR